MKKNGFSLISLLLLRKRSCKGFSLIELMVVVAIIGFLSAIGLAVYADVQSKGRDAKRKGDIDSIAKVLEIHRTDSGGYSPILATWFGSSAGLVNKDPKGKYYCIAFNNDGSAITDATSINWEDKDCPTLPWKNIDGGGATDATVPEDGTTVWKVCTLLDDGTNVYCRYSVQ